MREIKFRAWYKNQMWITFLINPYGEIEIHNRGESDHLYMPSKKEYVLMQFTGLKDKNGKEIYEGDIVRVGGGDGKTFQGGGFNCEVTFQDGCFGIIASWVKKKRRWQFLAFTHYPSDIFQGAFEVIGNIYENPELLNE